MSVKDIVAHGKQRNLMGSQKQMSIKLKNKLGVKNDKTDKDDPVRKPLTEKEMKFVELYVDNYFSQK